MNTTQDTRALSEAQPLYIANTKQIISFIFIATAMITLFFFGFIPVVTGIHGMQAQTTFSNCYWLVAFSFMLTIAKNIHNNGHYTQATLLSLAPTLLCIIWF